MARASTRCFCRARRSWAPCALSVFVAFVVGPSCLIVDPPAKLPDPPSRRPTILRDQVVPSTSRVLVDLPPEFIVPVEVVDRSQVFQWRVFVDYDSLESVNVVADGESRPAILEDAGNPAVRLIPFTLDALLFSAPVSQCRVIEFRAADAFVGNTGHAFGGLGGDSVVWFYNPAGDFSGCPVQGDGGLDAGRPPDASSDAPVD